MNPSFNEPGVDRVVDRALDVDEKAASSVDVLPARRGTGQAALAHGDRALAVLAEAEHVDLDTVDPAVMKRLMWKIDLAIMPVMCLVEFFAFLDKSSISYSNLFGFSTDNNLVGQQFAWLGSIFYFGYLFWQPFASWLLVRIPVRWHLSGALIVWGVILGCLAAGHNFASLAALRFLLGMAESAQIPILGAITGMWYTREEQATRVGIWFGMVGPSQIIGSLISYGMYTLSSTAIAKWQFIFVVLGPITVLFGIYVAFIVPETPATAWFLTPEERVLALERIRRNKTGTSATEYKPQQLVEASLDPRMYLAAISVFCASVQNGGVSSFGSTIIKSFGYSTREVTLLGMVPGASEIVAMATGVLLFRIFRMRSLAAIVCITVAVIGAAMMIGCKNENAKFAGYALIFWCPVGQMMFVPWMQSMVAGHTKRSAFWALYQVGYSVGNIVGAQIYRAKDAPGYVPAKIAILITISLHAVTMGMIALIHRYWNAKRAQSAEIEETLEEDNIEFKDLTDKQIKSFVYPY